MGDGGTISDLTLKNVNIITNKNYVGGIAGYGGGSNTSANIIRCSVHGKIEGYNYVGGITGSFNYSTMKDCYSSAYVKGNDYVGGLIGLISGSTDIPSIVERCYAIGFVDSQSIRSGGIVGGGTYYYKVTSSFYDTSTTGKTSGLGTGKTTQEMKTPSTFAGWDTNVWRIQEGRYPSLCFEPINRSFIQANGEYRKYNTKKEQRINYSNPIMTSNTMPSGRASASDTADSNHDAWRAFDGDTKSNGNGWVVLNNKGWLQYDFETQTKINCYKIMGQINTTNSSIDRCPKDWTFEGSNDEQNWVILDSKVNVTNWVQNNFSTFPLSKTENYRIYRINITENNGNAYLGVGEMQLIYDEIEITPSSWKTISTTLPSLDTFKSEGMDDLSVLNRKRTSFVFPMDDYTTSGEVLGNGKVFKEKIDLRKHFEIVSISTK
ncbi:hypothetical protein HMSSN036_03290 [Paenibacillus macerans]|nr:hypothetical protein HMSSN036_03290 [Paenibacillus macerans]